MFDRSRLRWLIWGAAALSCSAVLGQGHLPCDGPPVASAHCAAPAPRHIYVCPCPACQAERGEPERAPERGPELGPGAYVAPPQTGVQVSGAQQTSIRGLAIRFPEFRFELPSIELPHRVTRSRGAHMELDRSIADFRGFPASRGVASPSYGSQERAPETGMDCPETGRPETEVDDMRRRCESMAEQLKQKEALLNSKLQELEQQLQSLRALPQPPACPPPSASCPPASASPDHAAPGGFGVPGGPQKAVEPIPAPQPLHEPAMLQDPYPPPHYRQLPLPIGDQRVGAAKQVIPAAYLDVVATPSPAIAPATAPRPAASRPVRLPSPGPR